ncbi:family 20 glycosylhydrolase, partial [Capnocytophaga haemolytica]
WEKCPKCQARMKTEGLKKTAELQTYFIKRMQQFLRANGRTLVGWDEILEGGMPSDVVVMNWRGIRNAQKAVAQGNPMVLTSDTYINRYQGLPQYEPEANGGHVTLSKVYHYNLEREKLTEEQHKHILGSQANLWAEFIATPEHSEYMLFPRLFAFAEVVWTPSEQKDWKDFVRRVKAQMQRLDVMGVKYAISMYQVVPTLEEKDGKVLLTLSSELPDADIRYAFDGTPIEQGQRYTAPIAMSGNTICKAAVFVDGKPNVVSKDTIVFHKAAGKPVQCEPEADKKYQGKGPHTLTNVVRGTKNFQDGQWLGWLFKDATITIDMQTPSEVSKVIVGAMRKHNDAIFLPTNISVAVSTDGKTFTTVADQEFPYQQKGVSRLANFSLEFTPVQTRYIKVTVKNLGKNPNGGDAWLFLDEILVF